MITCYVALQTWLYHLFRHNCFHQVLLRISGFMIIILYSFISCLSTYILFHQSPALVVLYLVLTHARHLAFASPLAWGVLTPLDPHVQVSKLRRKGIFLAEDQAYFCGAVRSVVAPVPFFLPLVGSRLLQLFRERPFVLFILCILAFAPISDVIFLKYLSPLVITL